MGSHLLTRYRVDDVPWPLRPLFHLYGYGMGALALALLLALRALVRVEWHGIERATGAGRILCAWHEHVLLYFAVRPPLTHQVWINHPFWYMRPVHVVMGWIGVERIILGSSGAGGRKAVDELVPALAAGASTAMFPDGPAGPARVLKRGVLHLAVQTGLPVVPVRFEPTRAVRLPGWDGKHLPLPFSTVRVVCGAPITVDSSDLDGAARALEAAL